ncbi:MAG: fibronectin type III domain-containing protein [Verrucomicrobia bacterium]|nr:fibronectin type III domain-containing protein [Verrucomicrobiota bacterium]
MKNPITNSPVKLVPQLGSAQTGVTKYGATLGLPTGLGATLATHETELTTLHNTYQTAKTDAKNATAAKKTAWKAGRTFGTLVREMRKPILGHKYSQFWDAFGITGTMQIPRRIEPLVVMLGTMGSHLTANPAFGSEDAGLTGAQAEILKNNLTNSRATATEKKSALQLANIARMTKANEVQVALRELFSLLVFKLTPLDPRWLEFGFNKPGALPVPEVPVNVTAMLLGGNNISVKWPAAARAQHYRAWMRLVGQPEWTSLGSSADLAFLIENAPSNAQLEVAISAVNNGGESAKSTIVTVVTA